jgi:hypothetical protein
MPVTLAYPGGYLEEVPRCVRTIIWVPTAGVHFSGPPAPDRSMRPARRVLPNDLKARVDHDPLAPRSTTWPCHRRSLTYKPAAA